MMVLKGFHLQSIYCIYIRGHLNAVVAALFAWVLSSICIAHDFVLKLAAFGCHGIV